MELSDTLKILTPTRNENYVCVENDIVVIYPKSNRKKDIVWFLDGKMIGNTHDPRLELPLGSYELRCVDKYGYNASVVFNVLPR